TVLPSTGRLSLAATVLKDRANQEKLFSTTPRGFVIDSKTFFHLPSSRVQAQFRKISGDDGLPLLLFDRGAKRASQPPLSRHGC
ncbi:hypothetical protein, partial [Xanthomonas oryzae]|uniref:hypothetical protein n=1 Tax=Xanthomonas oryzae TaxID=347 RepID=UPI001C4DD246